MTLIHLYKGISQKGNPMLSSIKRVETAVGYVIQGSSDDPIFMMITKVKASAVPNELLYDPADNTLYTLDGVEWTPDSADIVETATDTVPAEDTAQNSESAPDSI
jgi:hypothetical protein